MKKTRIIILSFFVLVISTIGVFWFLNRDVSYGVATVKQYEDKTVKNVIFVIGDGMGENHIKLTSLYYGVELEINKTEKTYYITTHSANKEITDSAAAGTALATGHKTNNKMVGITSNGSEIQNLSEYARSMKKSVGIVTTALITDATPAAFTAHSFDRSNTEEIIKGQIAFKPEVILGGYNKNFSKDLFVGTNIKVVTDKRDFLNFENEESIFGLFDYDDIANNIVNEKSPSLLEMTKMALEVLEQNDNGYFLMVEGAQVDKKSHDNDIMSMIVHMKELDDTIKFLKEYVANNGDILLVITADHETGGLEFNDKLTKEDISDQLYSTTSHTSTPVPLYAYGKGKELFYRNMDNTDVHALILGIFNRRD